MYSIGLEGILLIIPPFFVSFFIGIQLFKRWQQRNLQTYLSVS